MDGYWEFETRKGVFRIVPHGAAFRVMFEGEALGDYRSSVQALEDLVGGSTFWPSCGNPTKLGISDELDEWTFVRS